MKKIADGPVLDARWKAGWKAHLKNKKEWYDASIEPTREELDQYALTGTLSAPDEDWSKYKRWERDLSFQVEMYGLLNAFKLEAAAVIEGVFDVRTAEEVYAAIRLQELISLYVHIRSPERVGRQLSRMDIQIIPAVALGVIIGDSSALPLMRLLTVACKRGWYSLDDRYPIFVFVLLMAADFLQESFPKELALLLSNSPLGNLLSSWNNPDPAVLVDLCVATCNFHTTRCRDNVDMEFSGGIWRYTPIEMMLLMRLRSLRGLAIPQFEHSIWIAPFANFVFSELPMESEFMRRFEQRMRTDGFDEEFITKNVLMGHTHK
ncbi:hypothetical protein [Massilia sp. S19_KUP03_FR1]|uniref:hypothetical protein n=1 Tax=Massilia sp. S19_KUP03_FR1 TaxID=3025503 RepID=UPI002FCD7478